MTKNRKPILCAMAAAGLLLAALLTAAPAAAQDGEPRVEVIEQDNVVVDDPVDPHRVRAVFIGTGHEPVRIECDAAEGEDCNNFEFDYKLLGPDTPFAPRGYIGVVLTDITPELRTFFGAPETAGVLVAQVQPDSPAAAAGLRVGDVITTVDGEPVAGSFDVRRQVRGAEEGSALVLEVVRERRYEQLSATVAERAVPEVDVRRFLWRPGSGPTPGEPFVYQLDPEGMHEAVIELKDHLSSPEMYDHVIRLRGAEGDLEVRIRQLEEKIEALERELDER